MAIRNKYSEQHAQGPVPALSSFLTLYNPKAIPRLLRGVFEDRNTLMAAQLEHTGTLQFGMASL